MTSTAGATTASSTSRAAATPRRSACRQCTSRTSSPPRKRFGTILENVDLDPHTRALDLDSDRITENTRGAYPLHFIGNASETGMAGHPRNVVFLTADAFGVLPPISRLDREQAEYHFISGYTAKLAGTEVGIKEPKATFSAGFGAPFLPRHPQEYAAMLGERLDQLPGAGLAGEHWLDRRPLRHRRADEHQPHPLDGPRRAERGAGRRAIRARPDLRPDGAHQLPRRPRRGAAAAPDLGRQGRVRPPGARS